MMRRLEFLVFAGLAALLHLGILLTADAGAPLQEGGIPTEGGAAMGAMSDELADLVESWDAEPDRSDAAELDPARAPDDPITTLAELTPPDVDIPEPVQPRTALSNQPLKQPETVTARPVLRSARTEIAPPPPPDTSKPQVQAAQDLALAELPQSQLGPALPLPQDTEIKPRQQEPEPDPNRGARDPAEIKVAEPIEPQQIAPKLDVLAALPQPNDLTRPVAPKPPELTMPSLPEPEPEPEETGPAPRIAALPVAKPLDRIPREVTKPKIQKKKPAAQKKKPAKKQVAKKKPAKVQKPTKTAAVGSGGTRKEPVKGTGSGDARGQAVKEGAGGKAKSGGFTTAMVTSARQGWVSSVQRAVARKKKYPRRAERRGVTGRPIISVTISASGKLLGVSLAKSSGSSMLDEAALAAAKRVRSYPRIPQEMGKARATVRIPIRFKKK